MNEISNPLDYLIQCCETAVHTGKWKLTKFTILNAKDELSRLRQSKKEMAHEACKTNQWAIDEMNNNLNFKEVAWATINGRGDMFNISMIYNQFANQDAIIPLYRNEKEFKEKYSNLYDK